MDQPARRSILKLVGATASAALAPTLARAAGRRPVGEVAVTIDDLPAVYGDLGLMQRVTRELVEVLAGERIPAVGFVNESKLAASGEREARTALLQAWVEAGLELGNHTYSHPSPNRTALDAYQQDVMRGENVTHALLAARGRRLRWFRHPFLQQGPTPEYAQALSSFLAGRGYRTAPVTVDAKDYVFAAIYRDAAAAGDQALKGRVAAAYVQHTAAALDYAEHAARELHGRPMRQVLLIHANELNAEVFGQAASLLRSRGYRFVTLDRALADPAYEAEEAHTPHGWSWLNRWARAKNVRLGPDPRLPEFVAEAFARRGAAGAP